MNTQDKLYKLGLSDFAYEWFKPTLERVSHLPIEEMVDTCDNGEFLLWLATVLEVDIQTLTLAKAKCAKTVADKMFETQLRTIECAERFGMGLCGFEELEDSLEMCKIFMSAKKLCGSHIEMVVETVCYINAEGDDNNTAYYTALVASSSVPLNEGKSAKKENEKMTANICREILGEQLKKLLS